ncbi:MAG TPA: hypothetical protein VHZ77_00095 [Gaiellaceae bacterium]|nr:hypothetical protein [Gaiellaceae bacterium]
MPSANVTSVAPPQPGAIPSATRPSRKAQTRRQAPAVAARTTHSLSPAFPDHDDGDGSPTSVSTGTASADTPGATFAYE